jgi:acetyl esterase/lipase
MKQRKSLKPVLLMILAIIGTVLIVRYNLRPTDAKIIMESSGLSQSKSSTRSGDIISQSRTTVYTPEEVRSVSHQNYGSYTPTPLSSVKKTTVEYYSSDLDGKPIKIHARIYQPIGKTNVPIFGFATGTVGIGDQCAPSLEQPAKVNWANYESHMMAYAGQGYAAVVTDYEGMRDPSRIHHYMVGALEGRAVLDSVRALINLDKNTNILDTKHIFLTGYSQGGHAAYWADQIAKAYSPELNITGVIGWGPVMDVEETLADVVHAANINWFGPYVITSFTDYYGENYRPDTMLLSQWTSNLRSDVLSHCIDTVLNYWGHDPSKVYTPEFIQSLNSGVPGATYQRFFDRMASNIVGNATTTSAKLINQGGRDNVVLARQQPPAMTRICANSKGPAALKVYPEATHYSAMEQSFTDTLQWMSDLSHGVTVQNQCTEPVPLPSPIPAT